MPLWSLHFSFLRAGVGVGVPNRNSTVEEMLHARQSRESSVVGWVDPCGLGCLGSLYSQVTSERLLLLLSPFIVPPPTGDTEVPNPWGSSTFGLCICYLLYLELPPPFVQLANSISSFRSWPRCPSSRKTSRAAHASLGNLKPMKQEEKQ